MSTGLGPYVGTDATSTQPTPGPLAELETTLTASQVLCDIGGGVSAQAEVFNGKIPGPTLRLKVGDRVVIRLINDLAYPFGIHWHGVELENYSDGTEIVQNGVPGGTIQTLGNGVAAGGTFLYKFKVNRAGLFWYHPHHGSSINRVFRGLYGLIVVTDPLELNLRAPGAPPHGVLPADTDTMQLVLSDITVCKGAGSMDPTYVANYVVPTPTGDPSDPFDPEWLSSATAQTGPTPQQFCEIPTTLSDLRRATKDDGSNAASAYNVNDVPSLAMNAALYAAVNAPTLTGPTGSRMTEGQTVLTNGVNVGPRPGTPLRPGTLPVTSLTKGVNAGQGLRLQIVNCAHLRYFRLRLTRDDVGHIGEKVDLVRIGGEGGLLDKPILEGGTVGTLNTLFESGEIVIPPGGRADVVAAIPASAGVGSVLTLWTRDYQRTGGSNPSNWAELPTVPVMHLKVTGTVAQYSLPLTTALRTLAGMPAVGQLGAADDVLFLPAGKTGNSNQDIKFQTGGAPRIDGSPDATTVVTPAAMMSFMGSDPYTSAPHIKTSRYARKDKTLQLTVTNTSGAHHPFHLHGFSFQPIQLAVRAGAPGGVTGAIGPPWPYDEFRDTIDLFADHTLTIKVKLTDREFADGLAPSGLGALGRWLFHCHIFFHHMQGMISELVVTTNDGIEKPNVNVNGSWEYKSAGGIATRKGSFFHRDGLPVTLSATRGSVTPGPGGTWNWQYPSLVTDLIDEYVYITASDGIREDQAVFRLQIGGTDGGSDIGDPHIHTVDGKSYDFQAAGEFILLRDRDGMEIQTRQTPVQTPPPASDPNTGLTECVSLNTAAAARVGSHRISYQLGRERGRLTFFLDGEPAPLPTKGLDFDGHRVTAFAVAGETALRVDYAHGPVVTITPYLWTSYGLWYLDVQVSHTNADEGIMGKIHKGTWLPNLPSGATVGPLPASLNDRHVALYKAFADAWRVTDQTSLFTYLPWTSTETFTDRDWPSQKPPCVPKRQFPKPITPILENIPIEKAKRVCKGVTEKDLHANCVFDVVSTGDETLAKGYLIAQDLRNRGTAVQIVGDKPQTRLGESLVVTATVLPLTPGRPIPTGSITLVMDGAPMKGVAKLDKLGRAKITLTQLKAGGHTIRADYTPGGGDNTYYSGSSPNLLHMVTRGRGPTRGGRSGAKAAPRPGHQ